MSIDKTLAELDRLISEVTEQVYDCGCGKRHTLRPNSSKIARVECPCGERRDFNLDPHRAERQLQAQSRTLNP